MTVEFMSNEDKFNYLVGLSTVDAEKAMGELIEWSDKGFGHANFLIGVIYESGKNSISRDYEKAALYYEKAVVESRSVQAMLRLASLHYLKRIGGSSDEMAFRFYSELYESNKNSSSSMMLGAMYFEGRFVEKNIEVAKLYLDEAVEAGLVFALTLRGHIERDQGHRFAAWSYFVRAVIRSFLTPSSSPLSQFP